MTYQLTRACERDILRVYVHSATLFGVAQADRYQDGLRATFEFLAANPRVARQRTELRRPVRVHPYQAYMIVFVERGESILVVRVLHGRQDWARHLHP